MQKLSELKNKTAAELREFLSNSWDDSWSSVLENNFEELLAILLPHKVVNSDILKFAASSSKSVNQFLDSSIAADFNPGINYIEEVLTSIDSEDLLLKVFKHFPSLPVSVPFVVQLINLKFGETAVSLITQKPDLQRPSVIRQVLRLGVGNFELIDILFAKSVDLELLAESLEKEPKLYEAILLDYILSKYGDKLKINEFRQWNHLAQQFKSPSSLNYILRYLNGLSYNYSSNWTFEYETFFEELDFYYIDKNKNLQINKVPKKSRLRPFYIKTQPENCSSDEVVNYINNTHVNEKDTQLRKALNNALSRSLDVVKQIKLSLILDLQTPSKFADALSFGETETEEKAIFFIEKLPSKYHPYLTKLVSKEKLAPKIAGKKTSYFSEMLNALKKADLEEFRKIYTTTQYTLEKFAQDSAQSSKKETANNFTISEKVMVDFTKDELMTLIDSEFSFYYEGTLKYPISAQEAMFMLTKLNRSTVYEACSDKVSLIKKMDKEDIERIFQEYAKTIIKVPELFSVFIERFNHELDVDLDSDIIILLAKKITAEEIRKVVRLDYYTIKSLVNEKDYKGNFILGQNEIVKLVNANAMEEISFMEDLIQRDRVFAEKLLAAYLDKKSANSALSALLGTPIKIRRGERDKIDIYLKMLTTSPEQVIDDVFAKSGNLELFKKIANWEKHLVEYHKNREVSVSAISAEGMVKLQEQFIEIKFRVIQLSLGDKSRTYSKFLEKDIQVDSIKIASINNQDVNFIKQLSEKGVRFFLDTADASVHSKLKLLEEKITFDGQIDFLNDLLANQDKYVENLSVEELKSLTNNFGLKINSKSAQEILFKSSNVEKLSWLLNQELDWKSLIFVENEDRYFYRELKTSVLEKIKKSGIQVLSPEELEFVRIKMKLKSQGTNFEPIVVRPNNSYNREEVRVDLIPQIIKFIEGEIDPRFKKLGLLNKPLSTLSVIYPYEQMSLQDSLSEEFLIDFLMIPPNIKANKKMMAGIVALFSEDEGVLSNKIRVIKTLFDTIIIKNNLDFSDLINHHDAAKIEPSQLIMELPVAVVSEFIRQYQANPSAAQLFKNKTKANIFRFVRTSAPLGGNYLRDILQMLEQVVTGVAKYEAQLAAGEFSPEEKEEVIKTLNNIKPKLEELMAMDHAEHMHGRVQTLASYVESNPLERLNQFYLTKLHDESQNKFEYPLYFPQSRGDLSELGSLHDWCVGSHSRYGDDVIKKGNILVGICEQGQDPSPATVIALVHFIKDENSCRLTAEQCRWSIQKSGENNVDATKEFPLRKLGFLLEKYIAIKDKQEKKDK